MTSVDDVAASLGAYKSGAEGLAGQLAGSKQQIEELQGELAALGGEGAASRASTTAQTVEALMSEAAGLAERIGEAQSQVLAIGHGDLLITSTGSSDPPNASAAHSVSPSAGVPGVPGVPPLVRRLADRLPVWQRGEPARAFAYSEEDGSELALRSGTNPEAKAGLTFEYSSRFVMDHVESHLAGRIRAEDGPTNVALVINKKPCQGFKGCDATLPDILPANTSVSIYVKSGEGTTHYRTYEGTGRGIA